MDLPFADAAVNQISGAFERLMCDTLATLAPVNWVTIKVRSSHTRSPVAETPQHPGKIVPSTHRPSDFIQRHRGYNVHISVPHLRSSVVHADALMVVSTAFRCPMMTAR